MRVEMRRKKKKKNLKLNEQSFFFFFFIFREGEQNYLHVVLYKTRGSEAAFVN